MKLALCTGGGDAPGLNAVIRSVVLSATRRGWEVFGSKRGFGGFLGDAQIIPLGPEEPGLLVEAPMGLKKSASRKSRKRSGGAELSRLFVA